MQGRTSIVRGNLKTVALDIGKTRSIGIEVICSEKAGYFICPELHFVDNTLKP